MRLIKPNFEILEQESGLEGVYKQIEKVGRTCYKSEDKISEGTAKPFVDRMIASKHLAMVEHGTIYLSIPIKFGNHVIIEEYLDNPYSRVSEDMDNHKWCVTTNLRVLIENDLMDDLCYLCEPTEYHVKRVTVKFTCDRGVSHEFVRHRVFSFAQESTRYCNYSKDKFNNDITFIKPSWLECTYEDIPMESELCYLSRQYQDDTNNRFIASLVESKYAYMSLLQKGWTPQQARAVLPNALKTELVMTGFVDDWGHFLDLRARGTTGAPHPQAKELAEPLLTEFIKRGIVSI
jgi:thymidylate synthase (FAD)